MRRQHTVPMQQGEPGWQLLSTVCCCAPAPSHRIEPTWPRVLLLVCGWCVVGLWWVCCWCVVGVLVCWCVVGLVFLLAVVLLVVVREREREQALRAGRLSLVVDGRLCCDCCTASVFVFPRPSSAARSLSVLVRWLCLAKAWKRQGLLLSLPSISNYSQPFCISSHD